MAVRCLVFGLGEVGVAASRLLLEQGAEILGCYNRRRHVGSDLGSLLGLDRTGIAIQPVDEFSPHRGMADVALFCTTSRLQDLEGAATECLRAGINVVTIAEDALFPWHVAPELAADLDRIAREGGATLTATGINDGVMAHLPLILASFMPSSSHIHVKCIGNFGRLGPETLAALPLGMTEDSARQLLAEEPAPGQAANTISVQVLSAILALGEFEAGAISVSLAPVMARGTLALPQMDMIIRPGQVSGITDIASVVTSGGVEITVHLEGKVFEDGDEEGQYMEVHGGAPMISMTVAPLPSVESTAAIAVNRIPDVIAAEPGYRTIDRLDASRLRAWRSE